MPRRTRRHPARDAEPPRQTGRHAGRGAPPLRETSGTLMPSRMNTARPGRPVQTIQVSAVFL